MAKRRRRYSSDISIDVSVDEIIGQLENDDLIDECEARGIATATASTDVMDELHDILRAIRQRRIADADAALERILWPKFTTLDACKSAYASMFKAEAK